MNKELNRYAILAKIDELRNLCVFAVASIVAGIASYTILPLFILCTCLAGLCSAFALMQLSRLHKDL